MDGLSERLAWFKAVILPHEAGLRSRLRRLCPPGFDVDNLVAESLARAYSAKDISRIGSAGRGYLHTIARNLLIDAIRKDTVVSLDFMADLDTLRVDDSFEASLTARDELRKLQAIIETLPPQCRQVFILRRVHVIAVQIFVVLIEFKLVTLAGFVLVPFGLFGRTAFLAEKVLGNVIASGVKVMVLAIVVGIGSSLFSEFTRAAGGQPTLEEVLAMALAALTLLGLSIFGPGVASGLVSGAPQLGAGAAVGTGLVVGGMAMAGAAAAQMAASGVVSSSAGAAAAAGRGRAPPAGGAPSGGGPPNPPPGGGGAGAASSSNGSSSPPPSGGSSGGQGGQSGAGASSGLAPASKPDDPSAPPAWARDLEQRQAFTHGAAMAVHAVGSGDDHSAGAAPSLSEDRS